MQVSGLKVKCQLLRRGAQGKEQVRGKTSRVEVGDTK